MKRAKRNWFSNFLPFDKPMIHNGLTFKTPEHFYQAMKTIRLFERARIANSSTPGQAKRLGRGVTIVGDWEEIKFFVMETALRYKFAIGTSWYKTLMATKGEITEWNHWHDKIWGKCICDKCKSKGDNNLGKLLMKLRDGYNESK